MTATSIIPFAELRGYLEDLGYSEKLTETAHLFHRSQKDLLVFRRYGDQDAVDWGDLSSTRRFLDMWGLRPAADFDAFISRESTSA